MVREIIKPQSQEYTIHIPKEYIDRHVEILVLPMDNTNDTHLTRAQQKELKERMDSFSMDRDMGRDWNDIKTELNR